MEKDMQNSQENDYHFYYQITISLNHPCIQHANITEALGMDPDVSWNRGEKDFSKCTVWIYNSWTKGERLFFEELQDILNWLNEKKDFLNDFTLSGGKVSVTANLPGKINIGDELTPDIMALAVKLGVNIGVEVFPNLQEPA